MAEIGLLRFEGATLGAAVVLAVILVTAVYGGVSFAPTNSVRNNVLAAAESTVGNTASWTSVNLTEENSSLQTFAFGEGATTFAYRTVDETLAIDQEGTGSAVACVTVAIPVPLTLYSDVAVRLNYSVTHDNSALTSGGQQAIIGFVQTSQWGAGESLNPRCTPLSSAADRIDAAQVGFNYQQTDRYNFSLLGATSSGPIQIPGKALGNNSPSSVYEAYFYSGASAGRYYSGLQIWNVSNGMIVLSLA